jgi:hypothetical protein
MNKICDQILDKVILNVNKPKFKQKLNQYILDPLIKDIDQKTHNYFITIITLHGITILLILLILSILITKKNFYN